MMLMSSLWLIFLSTLNDPFCPITFVFFAFKSSQSDIYIANTAISLFAFA